jgi:hypothetical protein
MNMEKIEEKIKDIKRSFRLVMNGVAAQSMREKGVNYQLNWGVPLMELQKQAKEIGKDYHLAIALWKENIRECKILATMIMPAQEILPEVVDIWMEQTDQIEIAQQASFNLYQYLPYAADKAYQWIASTNDIYQLCGFLVITRLFMNGQQPNSRGINEYIDQLQVALQSDNLSVKKAAMQSVQRFAELGLVYERLAKSAIKQINLDFL